MIDFLKKYADWLHLQWPAAIPEKLPEIGENGRTQVDGIRVAGDLLGVPLLKFAADSGAKAVQAFVAEPAFKPGDGQTDWDLVIIGGGVAGLSAALAARKAGLNFVVYEASEPFATIANFTRGKPIFTYPRNMQPAGDVELHANNKETLLADLQQQAREAAVPYQICRVHGVARKGKGLEISFEDKRQPVTAKRVLVCTGRSGDHTQLGIPGEQLDKVYNRLFDPNDYRGKKVLVVGGGDSALEAAISLHEAGADVALSYRGDSFTRPKPENIAKAQASLGKNVLLGTRPVRIETDKVVLKESGKSEIELANDAVFVMIGRKAPVEFMQRLGIALHGQWTLQNTLGFVLTFIALVALYRWRTEGSEVADWFLRQGWFPYNIDPYAWPDQWPIVRVMQQEANSPGFYYEILYTLLIAVFGFRRIRRMPTPYIRNQTLTLLAVQAIPLLLMPYLLLPLLGEYDFFNQGAMAWLADQLFPYNEATGLREYWRSVGFILAWPLFIWNVFTEQPNWAWLGIAFVQTFVLIPWLVYRYGKGAYCGWICSCGALAETLGDSQRHKMPHGPGWNRLNMAGQVILAVAFVLLALKIGAWLWPGQTFGEWCQWLFTEMAVSFHVFGIPLTYSDFVDYFLASIIGLGLYFHFSGRVWCRFFCPLAALMHIYARFTQFRIFADKDKCISCSICTSVCHQGIDVMGFANKGQPMADPECVRCSACVSRCPTGTLTFGRLRSDGTVLPDRTPASPVQMREHP